VPWSNGALSVTAGPICTANVELIVCQWSDETVPCLWAAIAGALRSGMLRLTYGQMAAVSLASLANARRLHDDAQRLRDLGSVPTAYSVAGLAVDELGKHIMTTSFFGGRDASDEDWRLFWRRFRRHQEKLGNGLLFGWMGDLLSDDPLPDVEQFHQSRLGATYVDVDKRGNVLQPAEVVSCEALNLLLERLSRELAFCEELFKNVTPERLSEMLRAAHDPEARLATRGVREELGPNASLGMLVGLRHGLDSSSAIGLAALAAEVRDAPSQKDEGPPP
jgi:AbiV family abortive infection protein